MPADVLNGNEAQLFHGCSDDAVGSIVSSQRSAGACDFWV